MNESNQTQEIFNKIINLNNNKASEELAKPITTELKQPTPNKSIYDNIVDTIENDTKGENGNGK